MESRQRRRRLYAVVAAGVVGAYILTQLALAAALAGGPSPKDLQRPLPLYLKLHKTGGTSVASALARVVLSDDKAYGAWRARLDGRDGSNYAFQKLGKFCGNYDGHWATQVYRVVGATGMKLCGGVPRRTARLVTLLRDPTPRFVSRLYYELGGATDLLLQAPFSTNASSWTPYDIRRMERIACEACSTINGGHCQWKGGICDSPQEYTVVLSKLGYYGRRGALQRKGGSVDVPDPHISPPTTNLRRLREYRKEAERALREDFAVVGVLEDLSTFFTLRSLNLGWDTENFVFATRKSHALHGSSTKPPCCRTVQPRTDLIQGRLGERRDERLAKRADAVAHRNNTEIKWSGVWPLLGWNAPKKGKLREETQKYIERRNADDRHLWKAARALSEERLIMAHNGEESKRRFDALQKAYGAGLIRDAQGFYGFCDWRVKDHERANDANAECRRCAAALPRRRCRVDGVEASCRAGVEGIVYE